MVMGSRWREERGMDSSGVRSPERERGRAVEVPRLRRTTSGILVWNPQLHSWCRVTPGWEPRPRRRSHARTPLTTVRLMAVRCRLRKGSGSLGIGRGCRAACSTMTSHHLRHPAWARRECRRWERAPTMLGGRTTPRRAVGTPRSVSQLRRVGGRGVAPAGRRAVDRSAGATLDPQLPRWRWRRFSPNRPPRQQRQRQAAVGHRSDRVIRIHGNSREGIRGCRTCALLLREQPRSADGVGGPREMGRCGLVLGATGWDPRDRRRRARAVPGVGTLQQPVRRACCSRSPIERRRGNSRHGMPRGVPLRWVRNPGATASFREVPGELRRLPWRRPRVSKTTSVPPSGSLCLRSSPSRSVVGRMRRRMGAVLPSRGRRPRLVEAVAGGTEDP